MGTRSTCLHWFPVEFIRLCLGRLSFDGADLSLYRRLWFYVCQCYLGRACGAFCITQPSHPKRKSSLPSPPLFPSPLFMQVARRVLPRMKYASTLKNAIVVVQPNIAQNMKWDPVALQTNFEKTLSLSRGATFADPQPENIFIVWPETTISPTVYTVPENMDRVKSLLSSYTKSNAYLITGVLLRRGMTRRRCVIQTASL